MVTGMLDISNQFNMIRLQISAMFIAFKSWTITHRITEQLSINAYAE